MLSRRLAGVFLAQLLVAAVAFGQQAEPQTSSWEFGRASGGAVDATTKAATNQFSFSLGASFSRGTSSPFLSNAGGRQVNATAAGALIPDRLWFFGTGQFSSTPRFTNADLAKIAAQVTDRQSVSATSVPASFQSLHFTGIVSPTNYFTVTASQQKSQQTQIVPVAPAP